ncbi:hypothetical protein GCM10027066_22840 [Dyella jejuensis]
MHLHRLHDKFVAQRRALRHTQQAVVFDNGRLRLGRIISAMRTGSQGKRHGHGNRPTPSYVSAKEHGFSLRPGARVRIPAHKATELLQYGEGKTGDCGQPLAHPGPRLAAYGHRCRSPLGRGARDGDISKAG